MWCLVTVNNRTPVAKPIKANSIQGALFTHTNVAKSVPISVDEESKRAFLDDLCGKDGKLPTIVYESIEKKNKVPTTKLCLVKVTKTIPKIKW